MDPNTKSCASCPSFLPATEAQTKFKKSIGSAMCGRFGVVLDSPQFSEPKQTRRLQEHIAGRCPEYGSPLTLTPLEYRLEVAMPDMNLLGMIPNSTAQAACSSCAMCKNFVRDDTVVREFGWTTGMCAAKGKLILPNRQVYEARNCDLREVGPIRTTAVGITLLPEYDRNFGTIDPIKEFFAQRENAVDPQLYPTDKEVSHEDIEVGIRAWRKVSNPEAPAQFTFLPIYDLAKYTDEERELVPKSGDQEHPELYVDHFGGVYTIAVCWSELDETPSLLGEAGTGKTELFRHLAWLMCLPFRRVSITGSTELDDIAGKMHYTPEVGTYFRYGRLPAAWTKPGVICIDEPNVGPPDVWQFLRPLTDNSKQLVLDQNNGEAIARHADCYMGMAMNQSWDAKNVGTMQIGDADANRLFHVLVPLPPEALEIEIIQQRVRLDGWELSRSQVQMMMSIAHDIRGLIEQGTLSVSWAIRPQIKVARALRWFDPITAYRRAVADYLEPEASQALLDVVRANVEN